MEEYNPELERFFDQVDERNEVETEPSTPHRITDEEWNDVLARWKDSAEAMGRACREATALLTGGM